MDWVKEGPTWPNHDVSRFVSASGTRWHMQQMGERDGARPEIVLLHGAGATTHSFADLMPLLAEDFAVTAIDLPGHGFTTLLGGGRPKLPAVAQGVAALLEKENIHPSIVVGHSAGAAVTVQMVASGLVAPRGLVSINGSFYPFSGMAQHIFPAAAKLLFYNPFMPRLFAAGARNPKRIEALIKSTGSNLTEAQVSLYQRAFQSSKHVEGALEMMANWDLAPMPSQLRSLDIPALQIIGTKDGTVKPSQAQKTKTLLKHGNMVEFEGFGHLVHEEVPAGVAKTLRAFAQEIGALKAL